MARATTGMTGTMTPGVAGLGLGSPLVVAGATVEGARSIWGYIRDVFDPPAPAPPPVVTPAAPQTYGPLTIPGAWTPEEMYHQTTVQQQAANQGYVAGSASGFEIGKRLGGGDNPDREGEVYMAVFMVLVIGVGGYMLLTRK